MPATDLRPRLAVHGQKLACPICRQPLIRGDDLRCETCGQRFPIRQGIPCLLAGETGGPIDLEEHARIKAGFHRQPWLRLLKNPPLTNNRFQRLRIERFLDSFPLGALILDLGSSLTNADERALRVDLIFSANLDLVGDAQAIPFLDGSVDGILCTGLLEHVEHPERVVSEIRRVLKPGGRAYVAAPFMQGYHPSPTDFRRYTREGLTQLFASFSIDSLRNTRGSGSALAWILSSFLTELLSLNQPWLYRVVGIPIRWLCLPLKYLDGVLINNRFDHMITSGFTIEVRKP